MRNRVLICSNCYHISLTDSKTLLNPFLYSIDEAPELAQLFGIFYENRTKLAEEHFYTVSMVRAKTNSIEMPNSITWYLSDGSLVALTSLLFKFDIFSFKFDSYSLPNTVFLACLRDIV